MAIQRYLATRGILIRVVFLDKETSLLRFGIIDDTDEAQIERLQQTVTDYLREKTAE